jgi:hypothetical protein
MLRLIENKPRRQEDDPWRRRLRRQTKDARTDLSVRFLLASATVLFAGGAAVLYLLIEEPGRLPTVHRFGVSDSNVRAVGSKNVPGCDIKGNINEWGERIYHMPGQKYYSETGISFARGERWFCSQWDAWWAGWRKAKV